MPHTKYAAYQSVAPYFAQVRNALGNRVEGEHFFDVVTDRTIYEVRYDIPGWPRVIKGRADLMAAFDGYAAHMKLHSVDGLIVHAAEGGETLVIEYEVHGSMLATGVRYDNRFCSIIRIEDRKIAHWRDYMDSLAAWAALTAPGGNGSR